MAADDDLSEYRQQLVLVEQKAQEGYDRTVVALSSGALAISFVFVVRFVAPRTASQPALLFASWVSWAASLVVVLVSHYTSHRALQRAIVQVDQGTVYTKTPGGFADLLTRTCNVLGGILFLVGLVMMLLFVKANLGG